MGVEFTYPLIFLLLIPCAGLIYFYLLKSRHQAKRKETTVVAVLRSLIFLLIILALTVPQILLPLKGSTVVFLVDRSASVKDSEAKTLAWIEKSTEEMDKDDSFAVAAFGDSAVAEQAMTTKHSSTTQYSGKVDEDASRLESGIQFASSLIPSHSSGRIVLFSDGNETSGNAVEGAKLLKNKNIELDVIPLIEEAGEDIALRNLTIPPSLYQGEKTELSLEVDSNSAKKATVRISLNDQEIIKKNVDVKEGSNLYTFNHTVDDTGLQVYKAEIIAEKDTFTENNQLQAITKVKGTPKILIVEAEGTGRIEKILKGSGLIVETTVPEKLPTTLSGFLQYQSIVFNNVSATSVTENQMKLIEQSVKEFGNGFVMTGGENSFGLGGYFKTPIEHLLPVDMDIKGKKEMPSLGLMIVLDRSGSMVGNKLSLAKEAAARSVELLREKDTFGFIAFDDRPWEIIEAGPLTDKEEAMGKIRSLAPGGGTEIYSSLEMAYNKLMDEKLQRKHIILLTDGQSNTSSDYEALIEDGKEKNITLSTVSIGSDADKNLLEDLADFGTGRFYDVTDASLIPSILSRETVMASRTYIEDNPFYPSIQDTPEWNGLFNDGVPKMNAYIATTTKQRAFLPLVSEKEDPVLAQWQYGMGTTVAFTSDLSGKWSGDWPAWGKWGSFLNQLVTITLPKFESEPYTLTQENSGEETVIMLESASQNNLPLSANVVSENGQIVDANTKLVAPGKYEIIIPKQSGMYYISVKQENNEGGTNLYQTGFTVPYSEEYLQQGLNKSLIKELLAVSGGQELKTEAQAFRDLQTTSRQKQSISHWLLLTAFLLLFVEITIRRFGLHRVMHLFAGIPKKTGSRSLKSAETVKKLKTVQEATHKTRITGKANLKSESNNQSVRPVTERRKQNQPEKKLTESERESQMKRLLEARKRKK
ncbi:VWA domain-containing protein [Peribacillus sp. TH24]|uniref:VWA domain-containing protein n=1 Tax=Peribacillus sp. TH24 TaxID=2798483 RepID=UPI001913EA23|nr:VWA domain-containing protein [Peribacillus sp. TH24]MBK5445879.1 VWA domain-containing protein [Peribacillus sp. TH24]